MSRVLTVQTAIRLVYEDGTVAVIVTQPQDPGVDRLDPAVEDTTTIPVVREHLKTALSQLEGDGVRRTYIRARQEAAVRRERHHAQARTAREKHAHKALAENPMKTQSEVLSGLGNLIEAHIARDANSPFVETRRSASSLVVVARDKDGVSRSFAVSLTEIKEDPSTGSPLRSQEAGGAQPQAATDGEVVESAPCGAAGQDGTGTEATTAEPAQEGRPTSEPAGASST